MSLFKRPAWAKTQLSKNDDADENIFSHSSRSYQEIVAEEQRKKREKAEKEKSKREGKDREISRKQDVKEEEQNGSSSKRRRITLEEGSGLLKEIGFSPATLDGESDEEIQFVDEGVGEAATLRRSPRSRKAMDRADRQYQVQAQQRPNAPAFVDILDDSDNEAAESSNALLPELELELEEDQGDDSDDELADLRRQARTKRRLDAAGKKTQTSDSIASSTKPQAQLGRTGLPTPPLPDSTIQILISSPIEGTKPLIVHRKLSQNLKAIREVWCSKQEFPAGITSDKVFLTYRMRKVYDATTCRSLGIDARVKDLADSDGVVGSGPFDKVHLEAVTESLLVQLRAQKAAEERRRQGLVDENEGPEVDAATTETVNAPREDPLIRLVLKAKGKDDFKLKVKPTTLIAKMVKACRGTFQISDKQSVFLEFDGERLDDSAEVQSTDISDMDCLDVHIG